MTKPIPGDQLHFLKSGFVFGTVIRDRYVSEISQRAQTITLTAAMIKGTKNRIGESWLDYLGAPDRQIERWGEEIFRPGPAPEDLTPWQPNSPEADMECDRRRKAAWALVDPQEQAEAFRVIERIFGRTATSTTINVVRGAAQ